MKPLLAVCWHSTAALKVQEILEDAAAWCDGLGDANWCFELALVSNQQMRELNGRFRGRHRVTDVLSFGGQLFSEDQLSSRGLEDDRGGCPDLSQGVAGAYADLWLDTTVPQEPPTVGEVVLAPDFILDRCREKRWPLAEEIPMLVVHGCLHLLGWDHKEKEQGRAMQELEKLRLEACGLPHPLLDAGKGRS